LRERPGPRDLYQRWEKQNWSAYEIEFSKDKEDWANFPKDLKFQLMLGFRGFFLGEAAVTDTLSPLVHAAPTDDDRHFLTTQLVDEARHTIFFDRFFSEALGIDGLDEVRRQTEEIGYTADRDRGYSRLFYKDLVEVTDAVRLDPSSYEKWVSGIVLYHMLVEGMLALAGQRRILHVARMFDVLPGFRAGFTMVTRDESRHVNYGVYAILNAVQAGLTDHIIATAERHLIPTCDVLTAPFRKIPPIPPEFMKQFPIRQGWEFGIHQLRKRLRAGGVDEVRLDPLEEQWWARIEANLDEYEERFDEVHPARQPIPA
ncbi:MAG TPA: ribonucleotide-diphosphate reductase subunit beta, partial [Actinomycetota bacterium]|nr:ribonucleotide-diphosphate reductase subunit beta [Actinomycetota bacterium]